MKMILKIICLFILISRSVMAEFKEVQSLNQGSCWFKESDTGVKVTSFNNGVSANLNNEYMSSLNSLGLPTNFSETYSSQLFCSTHGLSLVMNVKEDGKNYCLWFNVLDKGLEVQSVGLTKYSNNCDGYRPGKIIVSLSNEDSFENVSKTLESMENVTSVERISDYVLNVTMNKQSWGQEDNISKKIEEIKEVKFAEKSFFYHPIGEWADLNFLKRD